MTSFKWKASGIYGQTIKQKKRFKKRGLIQEKLVKIKFTYHCIQEDVTSYYNKN
jgi:hypothetical protein